MKLDFGKYKGCQLSEVPASYLAWLRREATERVAMVDAEMERRRQEQQRAEEERRRAEQDLWTAGNSKSEWELKVINAGLRALAKEHHPDNGGNTREMQEVNAAVAKLRRRVCQ